MKLRIEPTRLLLVSTCHVVLVSLAHLFLEFLDSWDGQVFLVDDRNFKRPGQDLGSN